MASNENLFHKLLGLPEKLESPNYFELLEVVEGEVSGAQVEETYKKQIQKVQRFTNNPKYKEAALFIKGELRKARGALIDEPRRNDYIRELLQSRTQEIRTAIKPLLIKGYLVEQEYQYLSREALRMRVPEAVIQQVIKQELEKKGIDPTQAIVENDGQVGKGRSVISGGPPGAKRKHTAPKTLGARMPWLRYLHPSELFTVETGIAIATSPLWMLGLKRYPPRHGQPVAGGLVFHAPFIAALILMTGVGFVTIPYGGDLDLLGYKAEAEFTRVQLAAREQEMAGIVAARVKAEDEVKRLKVGGGSVGRASSEEVDKLRGELARVQRELELALKSGDAELRSEVAELRAENTDLMKTKYALDKEIYALKKQILEAGAPGSGSPGDGSTPELDGLRSDLAAVQKELVAERAGRAKLQGEYDQLASQIQQIQAVADKDRVDAMTILSDFLGVKRGHPSFKPDIDQLVLGRVTGVGSDLDEFQKVGLGFPRKEGIKGGDVVRVVRVTYINELTLDAKLSSGVVTNNDRESKVINQDIVYRVISGK